MVKPLKPNITALGVRGRKLLFCVGSDTDWQRAGVTGETVTALVVRGLIVRDAKEHLAIGIMDSHERVNDVSRRRVSAARLLSSRHPLKC